MAGVGEFRRPPTAQAAVLSEIRNILGTGELPAGSPIRQEALAERFGVSRVPIREALKILEGEGQVTYTAHRGYSVSELSAADLREVYRIRELLEAEAVRAAAPHIDSAVYREMRAAQSELESAEDLGSLVAANRRFHFALFEASQMPRLVRLIELLWNATDAYRGVYFTDPANVRRVTREHRGILKLVKRGDGDALIDALHEHRSHAVDTVSSALP